MRSWIENKENRRPRAGSQAANSDRMQREAWPTIPVKSAYTHLLTFPDHLVAGDRAGATRVHDQILALQDQGGWTAAEGARLRKMEAQWRRRRAGQDAKFNTMGWGGRGGRAGQTSGHHTPKTVAALDKIRRELSGNRQQ
jgi:hypothetical protein